MRRLLERLGFAAVIAMIVAFAWFTIFISQPLDRVERPLLVTGAVRATGELRGQGPFLRYVALFTGWARTPAELPPYPLDDLLTEGSGRFELSAGEADGSRYTVLARYETARGELFCALVRLPPVRQEEGDWVVAAAGEPLQPLSIAVGTSLRCG